MPFPDFLEKIRPLLVVRVALVMGLLIFIILGLIFQDKISHFFRLGNKSGTPQNEVLVPTIVNGELVLPKVVGDMDSGNSGSLTFLSRLGVISANLIGVYDQQKQQLAAIRIIGEAANLGRQTVSSISPVIRFYDASGKSVSQKLGKLSSGYDFLGISPNDKSYYDVTVDEPPASDKLEIVLNTLSATDSAIVEPLKIASRSIELKLARYQNSSPPQAVESGSESASATPSAAPPQEEVQYFTVTGSVINIFPNPVSDISIYAWVKDKENKVYSFARQDFKNDLLMSSDKIEFRLNLLPLKNGEIYDSYEVAAWGKQYRLGL